MTVSISGQRRILPSAEQSLPPFYCDIPPSGGTTDGPAEKEGLPCSSTDSDCPVCFHQYSPSRLPKCLACRHVFCAVCLKLLVQNEAHSWRIACPICREATPVFGGLIASLRTSDAALLGPLASLGPNGEEHLGLEAQGSEPPAHGISYIYQEDGSDGRNSSNENREAARRLLFLLSLLMLLGLLVLPFVSGGLLKWALCSALGCGSVVCAMLCWNPQWRCSCSFPSWRKRASHSSPFA
ncbi:E3 ubiquitin-protein ligase RNF186-like [Pogona vitticeps]